MNQSSAAEGRRLTMFPASHIGAEGMMQEAQVAMPGSAAQSQFGGKPFGRGDEEGMMPNQKSNIMRQLAQSFIELDESETNHLDALMGEEQRSRERYIQQFQSISAKSQQMDEEFGNDSRFRRDFSEALTRYEQDQRRDVDEFSQDMETLRDLDRLVRGALPTQLESLASLAHDIQGSLKTKADAMATKARLQLIDQRLSRLESGLAQKSDATDLQYLEDRLDQVLVSRERISTSFRMIGDMLSPSNSGPPQGRRASRTARR
eukprot:gnl/MRDRNA2_/MRDRNA2_84118_c0_seq10.p1 gnl/MRDRNA2_/MRDRNA2_84118_c0~~gnl/MRDRNA2_/MRDRNA2_84118_c0_seq10.p1  ORF type:complete len:262 (+),score=54.27 gnl/MRDRNA2_/MRDRNA2_84118_c0_seq10:100-885(+)